MSFCKHHLLKSNYESIENEMNSGTFVKLDKSSIILNTFILVNSFSITNI